jgi:hypothetical protein
MEPKDVAGWLAERHAGMVFVADDLAAWLIFILADAGRKKLIKFVLGANQDRALRRAATDAVNLTASELCSEGSEQADELAMVVSQVFGEPVLMPVVVEYWATGLTWGYGIGMIGIRVCHAGLPAAGDRAVLAGAAGPVVVGQGR